VRASGSAREHLLCLVDNEVRYRPVDSAVSLLFKRRESGGCLTEKSDVLIRVNMLAGKKLTCSVVHNTA